VIQQNINMERKIEFRAKSIIENEPEWHYGSLITLLNGTHCIRTETSRDVHIIPVDSDTVCQLFFEEGDLKVYEGDLIETEKYEYVVQWDYSKLCLQLFCTSCGEEAEEEDEIDLTKIKVVGNIID
jgi:hypothetical protein